MITAIQHLKSSMTKLMLEQEIKKEQCLFGNAEFVYIFSYVMLGIWQY